MWSDISGLARWHVGFVAALITHLDNQQPSIKLCFDTELHFYSAKSRKSHSVMLKQKNLFVFKITFWKDWTWRMLKLTWNQHNFNNFYNLSIILKSTSLTRNFFFKVRSVHGVCGNDEKKKRQLATKAQLNTAIKNRKCSRGSESGAFIMESSPQLQLANILEDFPMSEEGREKLQQVQQQEMEAPSSSFRSRIPPNHGHHQGLGHHSEKKWSKAEDSGGLPGEGNRACLHGSVDAVEPGRGG